MAIPSRAKEGCGETAKVTQFCRPCQPKGRPRCRSVSPRSLRNQNVRAFVGRARPRIRDFPPFLAKFGAVAALAGLGNAP